MIQILNFKILWTFCSIELLENFDIFELQKVFKDGQLICVC